MDKFDKAKMMIDEITKALKEGTVHVDKDGNKLTDIKDIIFELVSGNIITIIK